MLEHPSHVRLISREVTQYIVTLQRLHAKHLFQKKYIKEMMI
jgi:hypothetical protein